MKQFFGVIIVLITGGIFLAYAVGYASDRAAAENRAEAVLIRAQAESRLTAAPAQAIISAALLPWGVLLVLGTLGLSVIALAGAIVVRPHPPRLETRTIIYLPAPGQTRPQIWQGISEIKILDQPQAIEIKQPRQSKEVTYA